MAIEDIKQLRKVNGQTQAQELLDKGWVILAVCVCQDGADQYAEYHLGRAAEAAKQPSQLPEGGGFQREVAPPQRF
ncbi:hypothetical protein ACW9I6_02510 [Pseudomonas sp. SDO5522_S412]